MSYDIFIRRRLEEIEEKLTTYSDPIERLYIWFDFIKDFTPEAHTMFDKQYEELIKLCQQYTDTPDPVARKEIQSQVISCVTEINRFSHYMRQIPKIQSRLEKDVFDLSREE